MYCVASEMNVITVVTPTHNRPQYLGAVVDSLTAQTDDRWELVIVDDGSTPPAREHFPAVDHPGIVWLRNDVAQGVSAARNRGAAAARGNWIVFLDDDDWLDAGFIGALHEAVHNHGDAFDVMFAERVHYYQTGGALERMDFPPIRIEKGEGDAASFSALLDVSCTGAAFRKARFESAGGFDAALPATEDRDLIFRMLESRASCLSVTGPVFFFRVHNAPRLSTSKLSERQIRADMQVLERFQGFLSGHPSLARRFINKASKRIWQAGYCREAIHYQRQLLAIDPKDIRARRRVLVWSVLAFLRRGPG